MSPALAAAIDAARDLAWRPTFNLRGGLRHAERKEAHDRLIHALAVRPRLSRDASAELHYLTRAMRRVALVTYSNRRGQPYYERKTAVAELRGCLDVYDRAA